MVKTNLSYHPQLSEQSRTQIIRAITAIAHYEARKEIKRTIQREGRVKLSRVPTERLAKAKASSVSLQTRLPCGTARRTDSSR
jgi:hypothetical protein